MRPLTGTKNTYVRLAKIVHFNINVEEDFRLRNTHLRIKTSENNLTQDFDVAAFRQVYN